ncbi:CcmD family protein [Desulfonatronovibrio hydrogenovorans]|nr:CcmD family protein [Desulfonatronovibrio hydrogenovorans]
MTYLIISNAAVWIGISGYLFYLATIQKRLDLKVRQLEISSDEQ